MSPRDYKGPFEETEGVFRFKSEHLGIGRPRSTTEDEQERRDDRRHQTERQDDINGVQFVADPRQVEQLGLLERIDSCRLRTGGLPSYDTANRAGKSPRECLNRRTRPVISVLPR